MCTERKPLENIGRRQPPAIQGDRPQKKLTLPASWYRTSSLQDNEKRNFYYVSCPVCSTLLWQPYLINTKPLNFSSVILDASKQENSIYWLRRKKDCDEIILHPEKGKICIYRSIKDSESTSSTEPNWGKYLGEDSNQISERNRWRDQDNDKERKQR